MKTSRTWVVAVTCCGLWLCLGGGALADPPRNGLTEAEKRGRWKLLFDGATTKGWRNYRKPGLSDGWQVTSDGALVRAERGAGDIITRKQFKYFELSLEYKISKGGNSGIMFHVTEDAPQPWHSGPEVQIQDNVDGHDPQKAGWLYQLYKPQKPAWAKRVEQEAGIKTPETDDATRPAGQWNHVYLRIGPNQSEVAVNGVSYYYFKKGSPEWKRRVAASKFKRYPGFGKATQGHICLQDHGNRVAFRNIKIRELADDGAAPNPVDGALPLTTALAFPELKWSGWSGVDERGRIRALRPMVLTHAGGGDKRVFVATQRGVIHVFENRKGPQTTQVFLDLTKKVADWKAANEEGLLGMAFHPRYRETGEFFVYYSAVDPKRTSRVSRFRVSSNPNQADPKEEILLELPQPFSNHNGGSIAFGPDGYLYIALGDGGGRNDPLGNGQNLATWMGSILRIDVDKKTSELNYSVPADNPFVRRKMARPEIFAYGFRNIWRLSFDRQTGDLWVGDVGQDLWEEINVVRAGGNYGWSHREATYGFGNNVARSADKPLDPVWEYDHRVGKSITGGFVYRGDRLPQLRGHYIYADFVSGKIWALKYDRAAGRVVKNMSIRESGLPVFSFGEDHRGEVYYLVESPAGKCIYQFDPKP